MPRYRGLQIASIFLVVAGLAVVAGTLTLNYGLLSSVSTPPTSDRAALVLIAVTVGGLAFAVGLVMNAVRAVVARAGLPRDRYRGPSIIVLLMLATVFSGLASAGVADQVGALQSGGGLTPVGSLVVLTVTQAGLLAAAIVFVALPDALHGLRILPPSGALRSVAVGLVLAVPAWFAAYGITIAVALALEKLLGVSPESGIVENAVARVDPTVLVVALVVVAPIAEEIFFRGVVYNAWRREYGFVPALLGSAGLFALIHQSIFLLLPIFLLGLLLAYLYERTHSLAATMTLHAGFNAVQVAIALLARGS